MGTKTPLVVVMGVSGSGKSTMGEALARALAVPYADADSFHPEANIAKMSAGIPLDDADRDPWLDIVAAWLTGHRATGAVVACSALKRRYRDRLRAGAPAAYFVHLAGDQAMVTKRVAERQGHFMAASMVESQYADLQPLGPDERGVTLDIAAPREELVRQAVAAVREHA